MSLLVSFLLINVFTVFFPFYPFRFAGISFLPVDPIYFLMILKIGRYALKYPRSMAKLMRENFFLIAFLAMVAVYVILDTPKYGQSAIGEARKYYFLFLLPLVALISIKIPEDLRRLFLVLVFVAFVIAFVALVELGIHGTIVRALNAEATLALALVAFAMLIHRIYKMVIVTPLLDNCLLLLFSVIVLGSGQRSVWIGFGFGVMLTLSLYWRRPILMSKMVMLGLVVLMGVSTAMIMFPQSGSKLVEKFSGITDPYDDATASWRILGWRYQLAGLEESGNVLFGEGLGGYYRHVDSSGISEMTAYPHNAYIQMVLKFGLCGLAIYGLLAFEFFRKASVYRKRLAPGPMKAYIEMGIITFGAGHGYMFGYGVESIMLIFFAVAMTAAELSKRELGQPHRVSRIPTRSIGPEAIPVTDWRSQMPAVDPRSFRYVRKALMG